jgi:hypothetical protein
MWPIAKRRRIQTLPAKADRDPRRVERRAEAALTSATMEKDARMAAVTVRAEPQSSRVKIRLTTLRRVSSAAMGKMQLQGPIPETELSEWK